VRRHELKGVVYAQQSIDKRLSSSLLWQTAAILRCFQTSVFLESARDLEKYLENTISRVVIFFSNNS